MPIRDGKGLRAMAWHAWMGDAGLLDGCAGRCARRESGRSFGTSWVGEGGKLPCRQSCCEVDARELRPSAFSGPGPTWLQCTKYPALLTCYCRYSSSKPAATSSKQYRAPTVAVQ